MDKEERKKSYPQKGRDRIKASLIIDKLNQHIKGKIELSATQVQSARILLNKALPDLKAVEHSGAIDGKQPGEMTESELNTAIARRTAELAQRKEKESSSEKISGSLH